MQQVACDVLFRPDDELAFLPEGPIACGNGRFSWVAIQHGSQSTVGSLNIFDLAKGENARHDLAGRPGFAFPTNRRGTWIVGAERQVGLYDAESHQWTELFDGVDSDVTGTIINEAVVFSDGLIFGTKDVQFKEKKAGLYLWRQSDRRLLRLRSDQICSNGKVILEEGDHLEFLDIDSPTKTVVRYSLDLRDGQLSGPIVQLDLREGADIPDGMVLAPDGKSVIIAFYHPGDELHGQARQYRLADSQLEAVWTTEKSPRVTCPLLIEYQGRVRLILTTADEAMPAEQRRRCTNAGCLFIGETGFSSLYPTAEFQLDTDA